MLLDFIIENKSGEGDNLIWLTHSPKQDSYTREICRWTESYLRLTFHKNKCKNIILNDGATPLHHMLWQCQSFPEISFVVYVKPGILVYYELIQKVLDAIDNMYLKYDEDRLADSWGIIRDKEHDLFCILNHKHNDCFQGETLDEWVEKCKTENLKVIKTDFSVDLGDDDLENLTTENLLLWRENFIKWVDKNSEMAGAGDKFLEQVLDLTRPVKEDIFSYNLPNLVYYDGYKFTKDELERFENVDTFHSVEELEKLVLENRKDTLWVIGNKLIQPEGWWRVGYKKLNAISWLIRSLVNSVVWAKMYDGSNMKHITVDNGFGVTGVYDV